MSVPLFWKGSRGRGGETDVVLCIKNVYTYYEVQGRFVECLWVKIRERTEVISWWHLLETTELGGGGK